ncbi:helix-turn-helix transcriptional regulator [Paenarthrobacter sp. CAP02]|uniref:helix-turn-helix domain-containing protein n=1 Tax=Paenarthrobacter sp. CAP02 TaxID=3158144 RepID=UPI0032DAD429
MDELVSNEVVRVFGANLRQLREEKGWSQSELARRMQETGWPKYSQVAVSRTEEGTRAVRLDEAIDLAALFDAPVTRMISTSSTRAGQIFELQRQIAAVASATRELRAAAEAYEQTRRQAWAVQRDLASTVGGKWPSKNLKDTFERELGLLEGVLDMDAIAMLEWVEDREFDEEEGRFYRGEHPEKA